MGVDVTYPGPAEGVPLDEVEDRSFALDADRRKAFELVEHELPVLERPERDFAYDEGVDQNLQVEKPTGETFVMLTQMVDPDGRVYEEQLSRPCDALERRETVDCPPTRRCGAPLPFERGPSWPR